MVSFHGAKPAMLHKMQSMVHFGNTMFPESPHRCVKRVKSIPGGMITPKNRNNFLQNGYDLENDA